MRHQALTKQTAHSGDDGEKNKAGNLFITIQADYNFYNHLALTPGRGDSSSSSSSSSSSDTVQGQGSV